MSQDFVRVYRAMGDPEAGLIEFLLGGAGIEVQTRGNSLSGLGGEIPFQEAMIDILVPEADAERAAALIAEQNEKTAAEAAAPGADIVCPNCKETNEPGFSVCWNCQADL